jgi:DNA-binding NarL/FixJ family response regulator
VKALAISLDVHTLDWVREAVHASEGKFELITVTDVASACTTCASDDDLGLILLDLDSTGAGRSEVRRLWRSGPSPSIAVARWLTTEIDLVDCVKGGALGYFPKELSPESLAAAMCVVADGVPWLPDLPSGVQPGGARY